MTPSPVARLRRVAALAAAGERPHSAETAPESLVRLYPVSLTTERLSVRDNEQPPVFDYVEGQLADREYLAGGRFSIADIATGSPFVNLMHGGATLDASRWPKLAAYVARNHARPSFKAVIEEEQAVFAAL